MIFKLKQPMMITEIETTDEENIRLVTITGKEYVLTNDIPDEVDVKVEDPQPTNGLWGGTNNV